MIEFDFGEVDLNLDEGELRHMLNDEDGDVGQYLLKRAYKVAALAKADAPKRTGALAASIGVTYIPGFGSPTVAIGSDLDYAYDVHEGTPPHPIVATPGRMLRFKVKGRVVYARAVIHPGTRADPFLERHLRKGIND